MNEIVPTSSPESSRASSHVAQALPEPRFPISIRPGVMDDLAFIDSLQKKHTKQVGWMPTKTLEGKIKLGHVLVAVSGQCSVVGGQKNSSLTTDHRPLTTSPLGYLIGDDQYFKRDDLGIIYQINIVDGKRRGLIGASLLKAQFERSAYGCKLYCCWCAQDIEANRFWEACGFVPLAFRAGSEKKRRVHIFWSKRIREGDTTTPWWFPSETKGGAMMQDRLVLPIPLGTRWNDVMPIVLPKDTHSQPATRQLESERAQRPKVRKMKAPAEVMTKRHALGGALSFQPAALPEMKMEKVKRAAKPAAANPTRAEKKPKIKNDPKFVAAARELRDRWLERVNDEELALPAAACLGKYDVRRVTAINAAASLAGDLPEAVNVTPRLIASACAA